MRTHGVKQSQSHAQQLRLSLSCVWCILHIGCSGAEFTSADPIDGTQLDGASLPDSAVDSDAGSDSSGNDAHVASDTGNQGPDAVSDSGDSGVKDDAPSDDCPPGQTVTRCGIKGQGNACPVNSTILLICDCDNAACAPNVTYTCKCDP